MPRTGISAKQTINENQISWVYEEYRRSTHFWKSVQLKLTNHTGYAKTFYQGEKSIKPRISRHGRLLTMKCKCLLLVILFQEMKKSDVFADEKDFTSSRSGFFATNENKQIDNQVVKSFESPSLLSCSHSCMRTAWCTSTNFKLSSKNGRKGTCELNKYDTSLIKENANFHEKEGVIFSILFKVRKSILFLFPL